MHYVKILLIVSELDYLYLYYFSGSQTILKHYRLATEKYNIMYWSLLINILYLFH